MLTVGDFMADTSNFGYYQFPVFLLKVPVNHQISDGAKILYAVLFNRWKLSLQKPESFSDENGPFMYFPQYELANITGKSERNINRYIGELKKFKLLILEQRGKGKSAKIRLIEQEEISFQEQTDLSVHKAQNLRDKTDLSVQEQTDLSIGEQTDLSVSEQTDLSGPYIDKELLDKELPDKEIQDKEILVSKEREKKEIQSILPGSSPKGGTVGTVSHKVPTLDEVKEYVSEKGFTFNPEQFFNEYAKSDWKTENGEPIKDWKTFAMFYEIQELKGKMNE